MMMSVSCLRRIDGQMQKRFFFLPLQMLKRNLTFSSSLLVRIECNKKTGHLRMLMNSSSYD